MASASKFVLKSYSQTNFCSKEVCLKSEKDFGKRAQHIQSTKSIYSFSSDLLKDTKIEKDNIAKIPVFSPIPNWEQTQAVFDTDYTNLTKDDSPNILKASVQTHLENSYNNHLKIFTDGSVLESENTGAAFIIPSLRIEK